MTTYKWTKNGLVEQPKPAIKVKVQGKLITVKPTNPMYDVVDTYASVKEYEEITGKI